MNIAVCVSGKCFSQTTEGGSKQVCSLSNLNQRQKEKFPDADFYYATWESDKEIFEQNFPNEDCLYLEEPEPHYHPYFDIKEEDHIHPIFTERLGKIHRMSKQRQDWAKHHTKQHLIHSELVKKIDTIKKYDIIVRTRFDSFITSDADFTEHLKEDLCGFAVTNQSAFNRIYPCTMDGHYSIFLFDQLIIHKRDLLDVTLADKLYRERKLHAAEFGWYQLLSQPNGSIHKNYHGYVNPAREEHTPLKYLQELK